MRTFATATLAALITMVPAVQANAQTRQGQVQWNGTGSSYAWYWRNSAGATTHAYGGGAYSARIQYADAKPGYWPAGNVAPTAFGPAVDIFCVDFLHSARTGTYNAYFTKLSGPLTNTRSSDLARYMKAAWLSDQMKSYSNTTTAGRATRANIHAAIWWIMSGTPATVYDGTGDASLASNYTSAGRADWVTSANLVSNYTSINLEQWTIVTDACVTAVGNAGRGFNAADNCGQEFLAQNVVPEPATMILLGTGLLATLMIAGVMRRPEA